MSCQMEVAEEGKMGGWRRAQTTVLGGGMQPSNCQELLCCFSEPGDHGIPEPELRKGFPPLNGWRKCWADWYPEIAFSVTWILVNCLCCRTFPSSFLFCFVLFFISVVFCDRHWQSWSPLHLIWPSFVWAKHSLAKDKAWKHWQDATVPPSVAAGHVALVGHAAPWPCCWVAASSPMLLDCESSQWGSSVITGTGQDISKDLGVSLPSENLT